MPWSGKALEALSLYFGQDVSEAMSALRQITEEAWFVSSATAFERCCEASLEHSNSGYTVANARFGVCFDSQAPQYVLLSAECGMSQRCLVDRLDLDIAVKTAQEDGCICIPEINWATTKVAPRAMKRRLRAEALSYALARQTCRLTRLMTPKHPMHQVKGAPPPMPTSASTTPPTADACTDAWSGTRQMLCHVRAVHWLLLPTPIPTNTRP
jgi:hypothetical protein